MLNWPANIRVFVGTVPARGCRHPTAPGPPEKWTWGYRAFSLELARGSPRLANSIFIHYLTSLLSFGLLA